MFVHVRQQAEKVIYSYSSLDKIQNGRFPAHCNNAQKVQLILINTGILVFIFHKASSVALSMMELPQRTRNLLFWCTEIK